MTLSDIRKGESKNLEFKVQLPEDNEKWVKTIIAFSNTSGGDLVVGIDDVTRAVIGVDRDSVFPTMDRISDVIASHCVPQIMPEITFQTIEDKTIIIVSVLPGANRPYYLKQKGRDGGTYVRMAGTTRIADDTKIRELEMERHGVSCDSLVCLGYPVEQNAVEKVCHDISSYRVKNGLAKGDEVVTESQLLNWNVLRKVDGTTKATNAFALIAGGYFSFAKIQCAMFKGTTRSIFLDKKEIDGPLYAQIGEAVLFVLRNTRTNVEIKGIQRRESPELPERALREMITNAVCHRDYLDASCVQVSVFDDRVEVSSPGGLYGGLTLEDALRGRSSLRNKSIAELFGQMGLIERWGTGLQRIIDESKAYGLIREPSFSVSDITFRVNLFRNSLTYNKQEIESKKQEIGVCEQEIEGKKQEIERENLEIGRDESIPFSVENLIAKSTYTSHTKENICRIYRSFHSASLFSSADVSKELQIAPSNSAVMMSRLFELGLTQKVEGKGKGKYRFL